MFQRFQFSSGSRRSTRVGTLVPHSERNPGTMLEPLEPLEPCLDRRALVLTLMRSPRKRVTIDDLMALRTINDAKISPSGDQIAYTVSTPSVPRNAHEPALFVIPADWRLAQATRGQLQTVHARVAGAPRAVAARREHLGARRREERAASPQRQARQHRGSRGDLGAARCERVRVVARRKVSRLRHARRLVRRRPAIANHVGSSPPATRLWLQPIDPPGPARSITASNQYVDSFAWSPDSKEIAYAWAPVVGFLAPYQTKIFAVERRRRRRAADHRSSRHERVAAVLAGRPQDLLHLDRRAHRHHRAARSRRRRRLGHERERARLSDERRVDRRDPVGARQPGRLRDDERRDVRDRRAHVRDADREGDPGRRQGGAPRQRQGVGAVLDQPEPRRQDDRLSRSRRARHGRSRRDGRRVEAGAAADDDQSGIETAGARRAEADLLEVVRRDGNLGAAAHARPATMASRRSRCSCIATAGRSAA